MGSQCFKINQADSDLFKKYISYKFDIKQFTL